VRWRDAPPPRVEVTAQRISLLREQADTPVFSATRDGERLVWHDQRTDSERADSSTWLRREPTLALWLAVHGWPLIRGQETWAERHCWIDTGLPEGLAEKIQRWEAYARHYGLPVCTPRIPGLEYPDWAALNGGGGDDAAAIGEAVEAD
jgi:hypothetical protein